MRVLKCMAEVVIFCPWRAKEELPKYMPANRNFAHIARIMSILKFYEKTLKIVLRSSSSLINVPKSRLLKLFRSSSFLNLFLDCSDWEDVNMKSEKPLVILEIFQCPQAII